MNLTVELADRPDEGRYAADATTLDHEANGNPNVVGAPAVSPIQPGSLVRLKSGGPVMTVVKDTNTDQVHTNWFDAARDFHETRYIPVEALNHLDPEFDLIQEMQTYIVDVVNEFVSDPPDSEFMEGYEAAMLDLYGDLFMTQEERAAMRRIEVLSPRNTCNTVKASEDQVVDSSAWTGLPCEGAVTRAVTGFCVTAAFTLGVIGLAMWWGH